MNFLPVNYNHFKNGAGVNPPKSAPRERENVSRPRRVYRRIRGDGWPWQLRGFVAAHLKLLTSVSLASSRKSRLQKPDVVKGPIKHVIIHLDLMSGRLEVCAAADRRPFMRCNFKKKKNLIFWCTSHRNLLPIMLKGPVAIRPGTTTNHTDLSFCAATF